MPLDNDSFATRRLQMVESQLRARGIKNQKLLEVMQKTPRHLFVDENLRKYAYEDSPLYIGYGQTISQPYIVATMTELANLSDDSKVLEIGTGSGYQAAILSGLSRDVFTMELIPKVGRIARKRLEELGYKNVHLHIGDGYKGWPEKAPFDAIIVTAAPPKIPLTLIKQLREGGCLIAPIGGLMNQELMRVIRSKEGIKKEIFFPVRFVPMVKGV